MCPTEPIFHARIEGLIGRSRGRGREPRPHFDPYLGLFYDPRLCHYPAVDNYKFCGILNPVLLCAEQDVVAYPGIFMGTGYQCGPTSSILFQMFLHVFSKSFRVYIPIPSPGYASGRRQVTVVRVKGVFGSVYCKEGKEKENISPKSANYSNLHFDSSES